MTQEQKDSNYIQKTVWEKWADEFTRNPLLIDATVNYFLRDEPTLETEDENRGNAEQPERKAKGKQKVTPEKREIEEVFRDVSEDLKILKKIAEVDPKLLTLLEHAGLNIRQLVAAISSGRSTEDLLVIKNQHGENIIKWGVPFYVPYKSREEAMEVVRATKYSQIQTKYLTFTLVIHELPNARDNIEFGVTLIAKGKSK
jgi:hypothetical protein